MKTTLMTLPLLILFISVSALAEEPSFREALNDARRAIEYDNLSLKTRIDMLSTCHTWTIINLERELAYYQHPSDFGIGPSDGFISFKEVQTYQKALRLCSKSD